MANGPGSCLHRAINRWFGEGIKLGCKCPFYIARMNAWGPAGCREHLDEIVGWLLEEAGRRGWRSARLPGARWAVKRLVLAAINESEAFAHLTTNTPPEKHFGKFQKK